MIFESDVGFRDKSADVALKTLWQMHEHGEVLETGGTRYLKWSVGEKLELWASHNDGSFGPLFFPYYAGDSRMRVALLEKTPRRKALRADGAFYCRGDASAGAGWVAGRCPFVFDTLGYRRHDGLSLPRMNDVQVTAYAFEITGYEGEEEYDEANPADEQGYGWDYKHFVPLCMTAPRGEGGELQDACAEVSGYVRDTAIVTNPLTGHDFCWARVETIGGEVDVVCSPDRLNGYLAVGGVAVTSCYLFGRLLEDDSN
jgi:hypothetical protein